MAKVKTLIGNVKGERGEQGIQGDRGEKGERGDSGIVTPVGGLYTLSVDADGNLYAYTADESAAPPFEYDEATGNLYYNIPEEG